MVASCLPISKYNHFIHTVQMNSMPSETDNVLSVSDAI